MILFYLIIPTLSIIFENIPSTGPLPALFDTSGIVYDEITNTLIIFGGKNVIESTYTNKLITFSLDSLTWSELYPESFFMPLPISSPITYLRSDRILLSIFGLTDAGYISDLIAYNLSSNSWSLLNYEKKTLGRTQASYDTFAWNNTEYIIIFGGITINGASHDLFL